MTLVGGRRGERTRKLFVGLAVCVGACSGSKSQPGADATRPDANRTDAPGVVDVLAGGIFEPGVLAIDAASAYFIDHKTTWSINSVPLGGGARVKLADAVYPRDVASDGAFVYWTDDDPAGSVIRRVPVAGGTATTVAATMNGLGPLVVAGGMVYFPQESTMLVPTNDAGTTFGPQPGSLFAVASGGGTPAALVSGQLFAANLAVDATSIYWGAADPTSGLGVLRSMALGGGTPTDLVAGLTGLGRIAIDATSVYFTTKTDLEKVPLAGGTPVSLVAPPGIGFTGLAVDGTNAYFSTFDLSSSVSVGDIERVALTGGVATVLAASQNGPSSVALGPTTIYWVNADGGSDGAVDALSK